MFSAFLLALMVSCNSESPAAPVENSESASGTVDPEPPLDTRREAQSVTEIPRPRYNARHILIAHTEATAIRETVTRSRDEAKLEATNVLAKLKSGEDFEALARTHSDDGSASRGGNLGVFTKGVMHVLFETATVELDVGSISEVVETPFGFHIIERLPVIEVHLAHILIQWEGLPRTRSNRTKVQAQERAESALKRLKDGAEFSDVAVEFSDGPFGKRGGDLGWFQKGQMAPQFDGAAFALAPNELSGIVESTHGFHIIFRIE